MDPLEFLPPEISLQCILQILPARSHRYTYTVLELASVSRKWQEFFLSVPSLWVEINVEHTINDLLAVIAVFLNLSRAMPLKIVIWDDPGENMNEISFLLRPHSDRISALAYAGNISFDAPSSLCVSITSRIIGSLAHLPNLTDIDFGNSLLLERSQVRSLSLRQDTRITSLTYMDIGEETDHLIHLTNFATLYSIEKIIPVLQWLPSLTMLRFQGARLKPEMNGSQIIDPIPLLPRLETLSCSDIYCDNLHRVIQFAVPRLCSLSVHVPVSMISALFSALRSLFSLQELHLDIALAPTSHEVRPYPQYSTAIRSLHTMSVRVNYRTGNRVFNLNELRKIFIAFEVIYPFAKNVTLEGTIGILRPALEYLQSLRSIQSLYLRTVESKTADTTDFRIFLPSLHKLWARAREVHGYFDVPNLLHLMLQGVKSSSRFNETSFLQLRKLEVHTPAFPEDFTLILDPKRYPALRELEMKLAGPRVTWNLTSFPKLMSINLSSVGMMLPHANRFFMALMYDSTVCPSLPYVQLADLVEWDLLFLMLQRRNFGTKGVKPINRLVLPFISPGFRRSLYLLLERKAPSIPEDLDISLVTTREMICDATM
jgi:hypothetical protein